VIDWDNWSDERAGGNSSFNATHITAEEGRQAFAHLLTGHPNQVVVSTCELAARLNQWINTDTTLKAAKETHHSREVHLRSHLNGEIVSPRNETEQRVMAVWETSLGIRQMSIHDNFFDLGGDSLLAIELLAQLHTEFAVELRLAELLKTPTVASMAQIIEERQTRQASL